MTHGYRILEFVAHGREKRTVREGLKMDCKETGEGVFWIEEDAFILQRGGRTRNRWRKTEEGRGGEIERSGIEEKG